VSIIVISLATIGALTVALLAASVAALLVGEALHRWRLRRYHLDAVEAYRVPATRIPLRILMRPTIEDDQIRVEQRHAIGPLRVPERVWLVMLRRVSSWRNARSASY
jgi:hypothetical protein